MKAEQTVARLSAIFLLVFLFTGTKTFSQTNSDQEQKVRQSRLEDSTAFDSYMDRRGAIAAIKDSIEAQPASFINPSTTKTASTKNSINNDGSVPKSNSSDLNSIQSVISSIGFGPGQLDFTPLISGQRRNLENR